MESCVNVEFIYLFIYFKIEAECTNSYFPQKVKERTELKQEYGWYIPKLKGHMLYILHQLPY